MRCIRLTTVHCTFLERVGLMNIQLELELSSAHTPYRIFGYFHHRFIFVCRNTNENLKYEM